MLKEVMTQATVLHENEIFGQFDRQIYNFFAIKWCLSCRNHQLKSRIVLHSEPGSEKRKYRGDKSRDVIA